MASSAVAIALLLSIPFLLLLRRLYLARNPTNLPPGPRPLPLVGNLFDLLLLLSFGGRSRTPQPLHAALASLSRTHGDLFHLLLGRRSFVVATSPAAAAEILRTHDRTLSARFTPACMRVPTYVDHSIVWSPRCDDHWRSLRSMWVTHFLSPRSLEAGERAREVKARELVEHLKQAEGKEVQVLELAFRTMFNVLSNIVLSKDMMRLDAGKEAGGVGFREGIERIMEILTLPNVEDYYPDLLGGWDVQGLRGKVERYVLDFCDSWEGIVSERKREMEDVDFRGNEDFLAVLLDLGIHGEQLAVILQEIFVAGTHTVATTTEWAMAELVKNPKAMERLKQELHATFGDAPIRESHLLQIPYINACVKETLRLHPPAPLVLHYAEKPCEVMGYTIPEDCVVLVNMWLIGRDPRSWEDPLTFLPERFLDNNGRDDSFAFLPFSSGRRTCVGMALANRIVALVVSSMVHGFDWSLPGGAETREMSMDEQDGLVVQRKPRLVLVPKLEKR